jgi:hypothetical protein
VNLTTAAVGNVTVGSGGNFRFHVRFHVRLGNPTLVVIVIVDVQSSAPVTTVRYRACACNNDGPVLTRRLTIHEYFNSRQQAADMMTPRNLAHILGHEGHE